MPLSCYCEWDPEGGDLVCDYPDDYAEYDRPRGKRCGADGCKTMIRKGDLCCRFSRWVVPNGDIKIAIYGKEGEVPRADGFLCEKCADIYFSLQELKFCVIPDENMRELLAEYQEIYNRGGSDG